VPQPTRLLVSSLECHACKLIEVKDESSRSGGRNFYSIYRPTGPATSSMLPMLQLRFRAKFPTSDFPSAQGESKPRCSLRLPESLAQAWRVKPKRCPGYPKSQRAMGASWGHSPTQLIPTRTSQNSHASILPAVTYEYSVRPDCLTWPATVSRLVDLVLRNAYGDQVNGQPGPESGACDNERIKMMETFMAHETV
jgi:hypothetical protein